MSRIVVIVLLLIVVFFGGFTFGNFEAGTNSSAKQSDAPLILDQELVIEKKDIIPVEAEYETISLVDSSQKINKAAGFFENIVKGFYEFIVNTLYSFANLFFE